MQNNLIQLTGVDLVVPTHGIEGAKSYPMGANCRVPLFDDSEDILYIKQTDSNGFPTIREFELKERVVIDQNNTGTGIALDDIRSMIREEISAAFNIKEESSNAKQFVSTTNSKQTNCDESAITSVNEHDGYAKSANTNTSSKSKQQRSNSSVVEYGKKQQQSSGNV